MKEQISKIQKEALENVEKSKDLKELNDIRVKYLGKKGELTLLLRQMGNLSAEERPIMGAAVNTAKQEVEDKIQEKEEILRKLELAQKLENEDIDITLPSQKIKRGSKHPLNRIIEEVEDLFVSMGYDVVTGPELENDEYKRTSSKRYAR